MIIFVSANVISFSFHCSNPKLCVKLKLVTMLLKDSTQFRLVLMMNDLT